MNKILASAVLLAAMAIQAVAQDAKVGNLTANFTQTRTIKASGREIKSSGTLYFSDPDRLAMRYDVPEGELLIINGNKMHVNRGGKPATYDCSKNAMMRGLSNTLLNCIRGKVEEVARDNNADLLTNETAEGKVISIRAREEAPRGYSAIVLTYRKQDGVLVRMQLSEFGGITTLYEMSDIKKGASIPDKEFEIPSK